MMTKTTIFLLTALTLFGQCSSTVQQTADNTSGVDCKCDTNQALQTITDKDFNRIVQYDTTAFRADSLYGIDPQENRRLWYRDIENPDTTKFTKYWNDYVPSNYHADHIDFINFYKNKPEIEIAFQFGPNMDLWAYHIFVIRKLDCCFLATRSYFRHARFTYKAYSIIDQGQVDSLFKVLEPVNKSPVDTAESWNYRGYFADNRNNTNFYIDFEKEVTQGGNDPTKEIMALYDFIDKRIKWIATYD